jgi:hypothetical protein
MPSPTTYKLTINTEYIKSTLKTQSFTPKQIERKQLIENLDNRDFDGFLRKLWTKMSELFESTVDIKKPVASACHKNFEKMLHIWLCSKEHATQVEQHFNVPKALSGHFSLVATIVNDYLKPHLTEQAMNAMLKPQSINDTKSVTPNELLESGEFRYIVGHSFAKAKSKFQGKLWHVAYEQTSSRRKHYLMVRMLRALELEGESDFPESVKTLKEKERYGGLTFVGDEAFKFFCAMESKYPLKTKSEFSSLMVEDKKRLILDDKELIQEWIELLGEKVQQKCVVLEKEDIDGSELQAIKIKLLETVVHSYCRVNLEMCRRDLKRILAVKMKKSHRKDVKEKVEDKKKTAQHCEQKVSEKKENEKKESNTKHSTNAKKENSKRKTQRKRKSSQAEDNKTAKDQEMESTRKSLRQSNRSKEKQAEKQDSDEELCTKCKKKWKASEWIQCDLCDKWWDKLCSGLTDEQWTNFADTEEDFYCNKCTK